MDASSSLSQPRLLILNSKVRNKTAIYGSALPHVKIIEFTYETTTLDDLLNMIEDELDNKKVSSIAMVFHSSEKEMFICAPGEARISRRSIIMNTSIRNFLKRCVSDFIDIEDWSARLDFLATYMAEQIDGGLLASELQEMLNCQVGLSKNIEASDIQVLRNKSNGRYLTVGELFFDLPTMKNYLSQVGRIAKDGHKRLMAYEKIRIIGKGAFGNAVLYRRRVDGVMVIIKEINMHELSAGDRQLALNEVAVLAKLDHPNIVSYHDSFERDGILMIEMEYADGGNLSEFLAERKVRLEERELIDLFTQMISAIRYCHSRNVLHRDLKTANVFLTKDGMVKIGDFGISKILSTQQAGAKTMVGTPYYISPEMCEGKVYDDKPDIWALGCIAYEMACLQKTFDGSNLPALVNKIMRGQFAPIRGDYSPQFKQLVRDMLQKDPDFRPNASEILLERLPEIEQYLEGRYGGELDDIIEEDLKESMHKNKKTRPTRSVLYYLKGHETSLFLNPIQLPPRIKIKTISVSNTHIIALTSDLMVFTWGEGRRGQLGHGQLESWVAKPQIVEALKTKSITHIGAGDGFSVFTSDSGIVMTCGDGSFGALGHGDWQSTSTPRMVENLLSVDISAIACGSAHVIVVSGQGDVYSWGKGEGGRLGLDNEEDWCTPQEVKLNTEDIYIVNVKCSGNATILISENGLLFACGGNRYNRLGLDEAKVGFMTTHIEKTLVPTRVKAVKEPIVDLAMGPNHTVCLTTSWKVISFGRNTEAQLGHGHSRMVSNPSKIKSISTKEVRVVSCGATFTVVGTMENVIYFWGTRYLPSLTRPNTRDAFSQSFGSKLASNSSKSLTDEEVNYLIQKERIRENQAALNEVGFDDKTLATLSVQDLHNQDDAFTIKDIVTDPQEILALYASPAQQEKGETVMLGNIFCHNQNIFLQVETTCPLSKSSCPPSPNLDDDTPAIYDLDDISSDEYDHDYLSDSMEQSDVPEWLRNEIQNSEGGREIRSSTKQKKRAQTPKPKKHSNNQRYDKQKIEKKQQELRMEAQNVIREQKKAYNDKIDELQNELLEAKKEIAKNASSESKSCSIQ